MEKRVKLAKKKLETLQSIQKQKQELQANFQTLTQNEVLVLEFVLEDVQIDPKTVTNATIEGDELVVQIADIKEEKVKKKIKE